MTPREDQPGPAEPLPTRARNVGLTVGALWLLAVGSGFGIWSLVAIDTPPARVALGVTVLGTVGLLVLGISVLRDAVQWPRDPVTDADRIRLRRMTRIVGLEFGACLVANGILSARGRIDLMPAANLIIVGLHFLPLARLFDVPRYYALGAAFCIIPAASLLMFSPDAQLGAALARYVAPSLACGGAAAVAAAGNLWEARLGVRVLPVRPRL